MEGYEPKQGLLFYQGRLVLPLQSPWIDRLFQESHVGVIGGHEGTQKTYHWLAREFYWVSMRRDIVVRVTKCVVCQQNMYSNLAPAGLLQQLELPKRIWKI